MMINPRLFSQQTSDTYSHGYKYWQWHKFQAVAHKLQSTSSTDKARMDHCQTGFGPEADIQSTRENYSSHEEEGLTP